MVRCWYCGNEVAKEDVTVCKVRTGLSRKQFPNFEFEDAQLCADCLLKYKKKEKIHKYFACFLLIVIFAFIGLGLFLALKTY